MIANFTQEHITAFQQNQPAAIHLLMRDQYQEMVNYADKLLNDRNEAEEITFITFIKLFSLRHNMQSLADIRAFLLVTIRNACYDSLSLGNGDDPLPFYTLTIKDLLPRNSKAVGSTAQTDAIIALYDNLGLLPDQWENLFKLLFYNKVNIQQAARSLNIPLEQALSQRNTVISFFQNNLNSILT